MISEIIVYHGKDKYRVNLSFREPHWLALMWGWEPDENAPSWRWRRVESVPEEVEKEFKRWKKEPY